MITIANPLQSQRRSAPCWTVQSAQPVHYEHFLQHFCEHFLMDLLLSIIFHQLTQQGAAFQSSALMTIIVKLHFAPPTASPAVARLWETLYLRWTFRVSSTSLAIHVSPCVCDWVYTEVRTRQILCLYSSWLHGTVKCSYDHHQPPPPSQSSPRLSEHFELWAGISSSNILLVCSVQHSDLTKSNQQGQSGIILCNYHLSPPANVPPSLESPDTLTPLQAGGFYVFVNHS